MTQKRQHVVRNASDEGEIKQAEDHQADVARDLTWVLDKPRGRRFLYNLIYETCHVSRRSHYPGSPEDTAFNEGARMVGEELLERIRQQHPDKFVQMHKDNHFDGD